MMSPFRSPIILKLIAFCAVLPITSCSPGVSIEATGTPEEVGPTPIEQTIRFTGEVEYVPVDANADGYYDTLEAHVEVEILQSGNFLVLGTLEKEGRHIANRPAYESMLFSSANISAQRGITTAAISFSGEQILLSGEDGPYELTLYAIGDPGHSSITVHTPAFDHTRFAEIGARLKGVTHVAVDADGDGMIEAFESSLEVEVRTPGDYFLQGNLRSGELEVNTGKRFTVPWGVHFLKLTFSVPPMRRAELILPFEGVVNILDMRQHTLGSLEFLISTLNLEGPSEAVRDPSLTLTLTTDKSIYTVDEANNIMITARFENESDETILLAHPSICMPRGPEVGENLTIDPNQSFIQVRITTPTGNEVLLRNSYFDRFRFGPSETGSTDHLILEPGEAREILFYKFHPYSMINPWDWIIEPIFTVRGTYQIQVEYKNNYSCAWFDGTGCADPWMGEVASSLLLIEVE